MPPDGASGGAPYLDGGESMEEARFPVGREGNLPEIHALGAAPSGYEASAMELGGEGPWRLDDGRPRGRPDL
eukprot:15437959-Alexandrium_andersonii.AAC.1